MKILMLSKPMKEQSCNFAEELTEKLTNEGFSVITYPEKSRCPDLTVVVGGDGTVLRYAGVISDYDAPVLGINFGHRGYLTCCEPDSAFEKICEIAKGKITLEKRMLYECEIYAADGKLKEKLLGLNEIVLSRGELCKAVDFNLAINGNSVMQFPADGVIVATPTGSTAYNFSASGPVLMPEAENFVITPICASALLRSSIVTAGSDIIEITMGKERIGNEDAKPMLIADVYKKYAADFTDTVIIKKSDKKLRMCTGEKGDFLRLLQKKMMH